MLGKYYYYIFFIISAIIIIIIFITIIIIIIITYYNFSDARSSKNQKTLEDFASEDIINQALVYYSAKGKCLRECKSKSLPPQLRQPEYELLEKFKKRLPYSYLHFSYYQVFVCFCL